MQPHETQADDILSAYLQNVRQVSEKAARLAKTQREHSAFLREIAARIGQARRSMLPIQGCNR